MSHKLGDAVYHEPRKESWFGSLVRACLCLAMFLSLPVILVALFAMAWWLINTAAPYVR